MKNPACAAGRGDSSRGVAVAERNALSLAGNGRKNQGKPQRSMGLFDHTLRIGFSSSPAREHHHEFGGGNCAKREAE
jgi:hypothetical protein